MRGIRIEIAALPRKALPTAIRRGLEKHPEIVSDLLNAHDLFRDI